MVVLWFFLLRRNDGGAVLRRTVIESVELGDDDQSLIVVYVVGAAAGCGDPAGVQVEEVADTVRLTARIRYGLGTKDTRVCTLAASSQRDAVRLTRPLGTRAVVDGRDGRKLVVRRQRASTAS